MSQVRGNRKVKSKRRYENKSTQTERGRSLNPLATINGSVILKITDYTKPNENDCTSCEETSASDETSYASSYSGIQKHTTIRNPINVTESANQTIDVWRTSSVGAYDSSDSDGDVEHRHRQSYDYLEGERMVTSLGDLVLSDSDEGAQQMRLTVTTSNEEKLAKFL